MRSKKGTRSRRIFDAISIRGCCKLCGIDVRELTRKGSAEHELRPAVDTICAARAARSLPIFTINTYLLDKSGFENYDGP